jgi:hypothetical protein
MRGTPQQSRRTLHSSAKFNRWLRRLPQRDELIARFALRHDIRNPGVRREWEARITELQGLLIHIADDWAALLPAVERARSEMAGNG